jgi:uncharacterized membrane protein
VWIALNVVACARHRDPYPFIPLSLVLSFQAACAAPTTMVGQNRHSGIDRRHARHDHRINVRAELEIERLRDRIDALREREILKLTETVWRSSAHLAPGLAAGVEARGGGGQSGGPRGR